MPKAIIDTELYDKFIAEVLSVSIMHCTNKYRIMDTDLTYFDTDCGILVVVPDYLKEDCDPESCRLLKCAVGFKTYQILAWAGKQGCVMVNFDEAAPELPDTFNFKKTLKKAS